MLLKSIWIRIIFGVILAVVLTGCESIVYYKQLISGQIAILNKKQPIHELLDNPDTPEKLKEKLRLVMDIRSFAKDKLFLPVKNQYLDFVELERPFASWNMWATPEFSFSPKTWCYPIIGCAIYRGYFSKEDAFNYGHQLEAQGYDVYIGGVAAYSTLGWLDDPVFSTFIYRSDIRLAALIFHELSHHLLYVSDDTTFNESFAIAVEQEGLRRWLTATNNLKATEIYKLYYRRRQQFIELVMKYRKELETLYAKNLPIPEKRQAKAAVFEKLKDDYRLLKQHWNGYSGYDFWMYQKMNNAKLISVSTYNDLVPAFLELLKTCNNDLKVFYKKCQDLSKKSKKERWAYFEKYRPKGS
ncbi:MAG TPA: aminopeptidase [Desulfobacterales bacterium]|nr:aminopeptidase [Desulfobacterales bacterium]